MLNAKPHIKLLQVSVVELLFIFQDDCMHDLKLKNNISPNKIDDVLLDNGG